MAISDAIIDELLKDYNSPEDLIGEKGIIKQLTKRLLEGVMHGELTHELGYTKHAIAGNNTGNSRNGKSKKTIKGDFGKLTLDIPRDRKSYFEPKIIVKNPPLEGTFVIDHWLKGELENHIKFDGISDGLFIVGNLK